MSIIQADFRFRLSGGASNADANASLGGAISSNEVSPSVDALFDAKSASEAAAGRVEYRCIYVHNANVADLMTALRAWIASNTPLASTSLAIGVGTSAVNGTEQTVANETTAPAGVTFSEPSSNAAALAMGDTPAGEHRALWLRYTVNTGSVSSPSDGWSIGVDCETA